MNDESIRAIVAEIASLLAGRQPGKVFQVGPLTLVIDFRLRDGYLLISVEPILPRIHLIKRRVRDLEKSSTPLTLFAQALKKELSNTTLLSIEKDANDRIVLFRFVDGNRRRDLLAQLTGRAANLFLLDEDGVVIQRARATDEPGQKLGQPYRTPSTVRARFRPDAESDLLSAIQSGMFSSPSEAADVFYTSLLSARAFAARAATARADLRKKISRQQKLLNQLREDFASHQDAAQQKQIGDLLLANISTAKRKGGRVKLTDYFAAGAPTIEIDVDEKLTLAQEAARRFKLYSRSKRAVAQISQRINAGQSELERLHSKLDRLEKIVAEKEEAGLAEFESMPRTLTGGSKRKPEKKVPGTRRYVSTDGFEILVGRAARDNDNLTFKVARPNDLWLHAADYSGSHVIVRNSTRKEIPHRSVIEAAQLAAYFSQANKDPKVDVHYTPRKFVSKPKGVAPGLVRMSRFKNIVVAPKEGIGRVW